MEPLGAVASLIAIGQALAALPKIVNMLRSMADVKGELGALMNEVLPYILRNLLTLGYSCCFSWPLSEHYTHKSSEPQRNSAYHTELCQRRYQKKPCYY